MKKSLYGVGNHLIVWLFYILFSITYISVLLSDNFILGDNLIKGTSTTIGLVFLLIALLLLISFTFLFPKIKQIVTFFKVPLRNISMVSQGHLPWFLYPRCGLS